TTTAVSVSVNPRTYGNDNTITPSGPVSLCSGVSGSVSVSAGSGNTVSHWIYSDNGNTWTPYYTSSTNITIGENTGTIVTRRFRALIIKGNACTIDTTAVRTVVLNPLMYGTDSVKQINITTGTAACIGSTISVNTNPSPQTINTWLYSDNG